jgi:hypothetical protein
MWSLQPPAVASAISSDISGYLYSTQASKAETDGSFRVENSAGNLIGQPWILEVKEQAGDATMQLLCYFSKAMLESRKHSAVAKLTCFPSLGLELLGHTFR